MQEEFTGIVKHGRTVHERVLGQVLSESRWTLAIAPHNYNTVKVALAKCNPNDQFRKVVGRNKAIGRLKSKDECKLIMIGSTPDFVSSNGRIAILRAVEEALELNSGI